MSDDLHDPQGASAETPPTRRPAPRPWSSGLVALALARSAAPPRIVAGAWTRR